MKRRTHFPAMTPATALLAASLVLSAGIATAGDTTTSKTTTAKKTEAKAAPDKAAPPATDAQHDAMMAEMMKYAAPGPEHAVLNPLVGSWKTTVKTWMAPGDPQVSEGTCDRAWAMGGRYLVSNYKMTFGGAPFEGMEILAYDRMKNEYIGTWIDNMGTSIAVSKGGKMDPTTKTLTLTGSMQDPLKGREITMREVTNFVDDNTYTFTMFATRDGQEQKEMEITYTRVK